MDTRKLKNNKQYYDIEAYWPDDKIVLTLKENPEFNLHIWDGFFVAMFYEPIFDGKPWTGFTRDYQEEKGGWEKATEIEDIDEYLWDIVRYKEKEYDAIWKKEVLEVLNLVVDFLTYAKATGQTVVVEVC